MKKYIVGVLDPGHFHAALSLRESHPSLSDDVYVYAPEGPDLDTFVGFIHDFNNRKEAPTNWKLHLNHSKDQLQALLQEAKAEIVILAGKNNQKMDYIDALNQKGIHIFTDKPIVTQESNLPALNSAFAASRPLSIDIMTERHEITTLLQKNFIAEPGVFGKVMQANENEPCVYKESVHHLYKMVNGKPLKRPAWYFDVNIQGEGVVDVMTHLVDMSNWMLFPNEALTYTQDIELLHARRWPTFISKEKYKAITGLSDFLPSLKNSIKDGQLEYFCNGEVYYKVKGVPVHTKVIWDVEPPAGGGDTHQSKVKGSLADLLVRQLPEKGFKSEFLISPHQKSEQTLHEIKKCLQNWLSELPGLTVTQEGEDFLIDIPSSLRTTHEEHFCEVRNEFMDMLVNQTEPKNSRKNIITKYTLLAEARKLALKSPARPLTSVELK